MDGPIRINFQKELISESPAAEDALKRSFAVGGAEMKAMMTLMWVMMERGGMSRVCVSREGPKVTVEVS